MVSRFLGFSHRDHAGIDAVRLYVESPALSLARKRISADERERTENRMPRMASLMCGASSSPISNRLPTGTAAYASAVTMRRLYTRRRESPAVSECESQAELKPSVIGGTSTPEAVTTGVKSIRTPEVG